MGDSPELTAAKERLLAAIAARRQSEGDATCSEAMELYHATHGLSQIMEQTGQCAGYIANTLNDLWYQATHPAQKDTGTGVEINERLVMLLEAESKIQDAFHTLQLVNQAVNSPIVKAVYEYNELIHLLNKETGLTVPYYTWERFKTPNIPRTLTDVRIAERERDARNLQTPGCGEADTENIPG